MLKGKLPSLRDKYGGAVVSKLLTEVKTEAKEQEIIKSKRSVKKTKKTKN